MRVRGWTGTILVGVAMLAASSHADAQEKTTPALDGTAAEEGTDSSEISVSPLICATCGGDPGSATDDPAPVPAEKFLRSPGGVDMRTGQLLYAHTDVSIGGEQGLSLVRVIPMPDLFTNPGSMGGFSHNWDIRVKEKRVKVAYVTNPSKWDYQVSIFGLRATTFRSTFWPSTEHFIESSNTAHAWLELETVGTNPPVPTRYSLHNVDGTVIEFRPVRNQQGVFLDECGGTCAYASQVSSADGTTYNLDYDSVINSSGVSVVRLRRVKSNKGYALLFEYAPIGSDTLAKVTKTCALNLGYTANPAITSETICPSGVPTSTYSYSSGKLTSFVDQGGVNTNLGADGTAIYWPGSSTPYVTNVFAYSYGKPRVVSQAFADGRTYTYSWVFDANPYSSVMGGSYTDSNNKTVTTQYGKYQNSNEDPTWYVTSGPETTTDELGRSWLYNYGCSSTAAFCGPGMLRESTDPEGNAVQLTYGSYRRIIEQRHIAKPGSGLSDIVTSSTYSSTCGVYCDKPLSTTDGNGHTTNYTYDPTHAGLLTRMDPAPAAGGARPLTVNSYAQRYAWAKNSSGVLTQEGVPVWTLVTSTACQTIAGTNPSPVCDGLALQTVTTYQYGANGGAEALLIKGVAVSSGGTTLRTCYTYDAIGNKISETKPNANLSVCP